MWSAIAGAQGTGACSRLSPPVPGPHGGRGRTCRTPPWACSVSSQSGASRKRVRSCRTRGVHLGVGSRHPRPYVVVGVRMDTLGHSDAPAACIVMEGSGRAGPSVVVNASRRERDAPSQHSLCTTTCPGENLKTRSRPVDTEMFTGGLCKCKACHTTTLNFTLTLIEIACSCVRTLSSDTSHHHVQWWRTAVGHPTTLGTARQHSGAQTAMPETHVGPQR